MLESSGSELFQRYARVTIQIQTKTPCPRRAKYCTYDCIVEKAENVIMLCY